VGVVSAVVGGAIGREFDLFSPEERIRFFKAVGARQYDRTSKSGISDFLVQRYKKSQQRL